MMQFVKQHQVYFTSDFILILLLLKRSLKRHTHIIYIFIYIVIYSYVIYNNIKRKSDQQCGASV